MVAKKTAVQQMASSSSRGRAASAGVDASGGTAKDVGGKKSTRQGGASQHADAVSTASTAATAKSVKRVKALESPAAEPAVAGKTAAKAAKAANAKTANAKKTVAKKVAAKKTAASTTAAGTAAAEAETGTGKSAAVDPGVPEVSAKVAAKKTARKSTAKKAGAARAAKQTGATTVVAKKTSGTATAAKKAVPKARAAAVEPGELAVRPGEDPWTTEEVEEARAELLSEDARLRAEITNSEESLVGLMRDSGDGAGDDQADTGTKNITREHEMALAANAREMLIQTDRALERLAAGTYGLCESCGNAIGKARMQAFSRATLCVECKQKQERRY